MGGWLTILDDRGNNLPPGETGTIFVESALISEGYIASGDGDGFRREGRLATVGDLGYPSEIEAALLAAPGIQAAVAFGLDDPDLGSELVAILQTNRDRFNRQALDRHLTAALPRYKHPRKVWLCQEMPMTASGKVAAGRLRQWIAEENGAIDRLF